MSELYEAHVTVAKPDSDGKRQWLNANAMKYKWKTSEIDGDPVLGKKLFFYFTTYSDSQDDLMLRVRELVRALRDQNIEVIREKIEKIVHDVRY